VVGIDGVTDTCFVPAPDNDPHESGTVLSGGGDAPDMRHGPDDTARGVVLEPTDSDGSAFFSRID